MVASSDSMLGLRSDSNERKDNFTEGEYLEGTGCKTNLVENQRQLTFVGLSVNSSSAMVRRSRFVVVSSAVCVLLCVILGNTVTNPFVETTRVSPVVMPAQNSSSNVVSIISKFWLPTPFSMTVCMPGFSTGWSLIMIACTILPASYSKYIAFTCCISDPAGVEKKQRRTSVFE